jgi:hypothetical protein
VACGLHDTARHATTEDIDVVITGRWSPVIQMEGEEMSNQRLWLGLSGVAALAAASLVVLTPVQFVSSAVPDTPAVVAPRLWEESLHAVDAALQRHDVSAAVRSWHDAYAAALASRRWDALLAAGEAFVRIGEASNSRAGAKPNARRAYLAALVQAERQRSVEGVRGAAAAFAALGDQTVASYCERIAEVLAANRVTR